MEYTTILGYNIPKLTLGTVALGMDYGVFQYQDRPRHQECFEILSTAFASGITVLDTARGYGEAEKLIGEYVEKEKKDFTVITKFKISPENIRNKERARVEMMESIKTSRKLLRLKQIPIVLFHMDSHLPIQEVLGILPGLFADLKHEGLIEYAGISADHPSEVDWYLEYPIFSAIQVPMNVFDQRLIKTNTLARLKEMNKLVFVRSVFLKGLLFMSPDDLKGNLKEAGEYIKRLHELAQDANMSVAQLAFSYIRDLEGVTSIVFGAEKAMQVKQNVELAKGEVLSDSLRKQLSILFDSVPEDILTPRNWSIK